MVEISVVVPIYNVEKYLKKCLESLVSQSINNYEVICVNDGSTDNSEQIIDEFIENYPNIFIKLNKINGGLSDARNYGLEHSKGKYIMFLDSDDWIDSNCLEEMLHFLKKEDCDAVVCGINNVTENGNLIDSFCIFECKIITKEEMLMESNSAANILFKKDLFNEIKFPLNKWYEDLATVPLILAKANKIGAIDKCFYNYLYRSNSITRTYSEKLLDILDAFTTIIDSQYYTQNFIEKLYKKHLYFTLIRTYNIQDLSLKKEIMKKLYEYSIKYFNISNLKKINQGINEYVVIILFFNKWNYILTSLLSFEWKLKKLQLKYKNRRN